MTSAALEHMEVDRHLPSLTAGPCGPHAKGKTTLATKGSGEGRRSPETHQVNPWSSVLSEHLANVSINEARK